MKSRAETDGLSFLCAVKYPTASTYVFGSNGDQKSCLYRLAEHAEMYGTDPNSEGYVFDLTNKKIVTSFKGGRGSDGLVNRLCIGCGKTYQTSPELAYYYVCEECRAEQAAEG